MTPNQLAHETDSAVERLLLKSNGEKKTVQDVFEVVVAMNHDRKADTIRLLGEIKTNREVVDAHITNTAHLHNAELAEIVAKAERSKVVAEKLDGVVRVVEADIRGIKENCQQLHERAPRRAGDPETENWGSGVYEDTEMGDLRRAWRFLRWVVFIVGGAFLIAVGDHIGHLIWPT